jgi:hypothetical protein
MRPARKASRPASMAFFMALAISTGSLRGGDRGVHQHAVAAKLHGNRGVRGRTHARVDQNGHPRILHDLADVVAILDPEAGPDRGGQRHHRHAADGLQATWPEAGRRSCRPSRRNRRPPGSRRQSTCLEDVGVQGLLVAQNLQLHQCVAVEQFPGEATRADGLLGAIAARGIGQVACSGRAASRPADSARRDSGRCWSAGSRR